MSDITNALAFIETQIEFAEVIETSVAKDRDENDCFRWPLTRARHAVFARTRLFAAWLTAVSPVKGPRHDIPAPKMRSERVPNGMEQSR